MEYFTIQIQEPILTQNYCEQDIAFPSDVFWVRHAILFNENAAGTRDESPKNVCVGG